MPQRKPSIERQDYLRDCYKGKTGYADGIPFEILQAVHIDSELEDAILTAVKKGRDVVLTGNPGDGKTHLLRVLEKCIGKACPNAVIELDASQHDNEEIVASWRKAVRAKNPFCIAVNEGVLKDLADNNSGFDRIAIAQRQVENAVVYLSLRDNEPSPESSPVTAFDLSHRNILSAEIVNKVFDRLTDETVFPVPFECADSDGDFLLHKQVLADTLFRARLQRIFDQVAQTGFHATLRDLQGFVSFLLFRGVSYAQLAKEWGDAANFITELIFTGQGPLFNAIRRVFDPATISHPLWDERLLVADIPVDGWSLEWAAPLNATAINDVEELRRRRRRFYFLHRDGDAYRKISDNLSSRFSQLLESDERECLRSLLAYVNAAFGSRMADDRLRIWESHHYDHKPESVLCSARSIERKELEVARPALRSPMRNAFARQVDHLHLRLRQKPRVRLAVDYDLFGILLQAAAGVPVLSLRSHLTRRLWQFMEQLAAEHTVLMSDEYNVTVVDMRTGNHTTVTIDPERQQYLAVKDG